MRPSTSTRPIGRATTCAPPHPGLASDLKDCSVIPTDWEIHSSDLLAGKGNLAQCGRTQVILGGLRRIEDAARNTGAMEAMKVCPHERISRDWQLNLINNAVAAANRNPMPSK